MLLLQSRHESYWKNVNTRPQHRQVLENFACLVPRCNYADVFGKIRLLKRGSEPAAVEERAEQTGLAGFNFPRGENPLICMKMLLYKGILLTGESGF